MRTNILQLIHKKNNVKFEVDKIIKYICEVQIFSGEKTTESKEKWYTLETLIDDYLIARWKYREIAETVNDVFKLADMLNYTHPVFK